MRVEVAESQDSIKNTIYTVKFFIADEKWLGFQIGSDSPLLNREPNLKFDLERIKTFALTILEVVDTRLKEIP